MKKYLVIGNPIEHSLSPKLHNYWLGKNKIDGNYEKKLLTDDKIGEFLKSNQSISGINVTVPFKKTVINYCTDLTTLALSSQSVNIITLSNEKIIGDLKNSKLSYQSLKIGKILESDNKQFVKQRIDKMIQDLDFCITNLSS